jgi:hypothetical protein
MLFLEYTARTIPLCRSTSHMSISRTRRSRSPIRASEVARQPLQSGGADHERATGEEFFCLDVSLSTTFPEATWERSSD